MLCLTRKRDQAFTITTEAGTKITILVCHADRGVCQLGIDAPHTISILRTEAKKRSKEMT